MKVTPNHYIGLESKVRVFNEGILELERTKEILLRQLLSIPVVTFEKHYYGARRSGRTLSQVDVVRSR